MNARPRAQRLLDAADRREREPGRARAEDHGRDEHVQAVDRAGVDERGDRPGPALDEEAPETTGIEGGDDRVRREGCVTGSDLDAFDTRRRRAAVAADDEALRAVLGEAAGVRRKPAVRI